MNIRVSRVICLKWSRTNNRCRVLSTSVKKKSFIKLPALYSDSEVSVNLFIVIIFAYTEPTHIAIVHAYGQYNYSNYANYIRQAPRNNTLYGCQTVE